MGQVCRIQNGVVVVRSQVYWSPVDLLWFTAQTYQYESLRSRLHHFRPKVVFVNSRMLHHISWCKSDLLQRIPCILWLFYHLFVTAVQFRPRLFEKHHPNRVLMRFCENSLCLFIDWNVVIDDDFFYCAVMPQQKSVYSSRIDFRCVKKRLQPLRSLSNGSDCRLIADVVLMIWCHSVSRPCIFIEISCICHYFAESLPFVSLHIFEKTQRFIIGREVLVDKLGLLSTQALAESVVLGFIDLEDRCLDVAQVRLLDVSQLRIEFRSLFLPLHQVSRTRWLSRAGLAPAEHKSNIIIRLPLHKYPIESIKQTKWGFGFGEREALLVK